MTAATDAPVRHRAPRATSSVPLSAARLLRVELRRNAMPWILPLIAALFWFDSYRPSTGMSPLYGWRTFWSMGEGHTILDFGQQATVIVSTHLVEDVGAACTEVALMDAGKIVFYGTPDELTARGEGTGAAGDAPLERGYSAVLTAARSVTAAR